MKRALKSATPDKLAAFAAASPDADWETFRKKPGRYRQVVRQIRADQHGLCAYCEIDLLQAQGNGLEDDFRVEHFHPKSQQDGDNNWALDWQNLLGTCHGGSARNVADPQRFTSPDFCCDVGKSDHALHDTLLNPLTDIPAFPALFEYRESSGEIMVDPLLCPPHLQEKAHSSIAFLRLNARRLLRFRREILEQLNDALTQLLQEGASIEQAGSILAEAQFADALPKFFTCVRWYLGQEAEEQLQKMGYQG